MRRLSVLITRRVQVTQSQQRKTQGLDYMRLRNGGDAGRRGLRFPRTDDDSHEGDVTCSQPTFAPVSLITLPDCAEL